MTIALVETLAEGRMASETEFIGPANWHTRVESALIRSTVKPMLHSATQVGRVINRVNPAGVQRTALGGGDGLLQYLPPVRGVRARRVQLPHCEAEWLEPASIGDAQTPVIVYFHGGAFVTGSIHTHRPLTSRLAREAGARVLSVNYRLLPLHTAEDAISDCLDAYRLVLDAGVDPSRIVFAGDSAGGYFSAITPVYAREAGLPVPAGSVLLSGLTSSSIAAKFSATAARSDAMFSKSTINFIHQVYVRGNGQREVPVTPVDCDLHGLGPYLIQIGSGELLYNDAIMLTQKLAATGVPYRLQVFDRAPHVFQFAAPTNPDAAYAVTSIGHFVAETTGLEQVAGRAGRRRRRSA